MGEHLKLYRGALQADAYAGFHHRYEQGTIFKVACWAHARRKFHAIHIAPASPTTTEAIAATLRFRHLLEKHDLGGAMLDAVNQHRATKGIRIETGTIVDATMIHAPSSTKNEKKQRGPAMRQTRKGKQWYFGLKAHIGVDAKEGHAHSVAASARPTSWTCTCYRICANFALINLYLHRKSPARLAA